VNANQMMRELEQAEQDASVAALHAKYDGTKHAAFYADYMKIAVACEWAFGAWAGLKPDIRQRDGGDGGIDFTLPLLATVDVKGIHEGDQYLAHKVDKPMADIYVLAEYIEARNCAHLIGWVPGPVLKAQPPAKLRPDGYLNHLLQRTQLFPMISLGAMLPQRRG
jgi:hypothetical protein